MPPPLRRPPKLTRREFLRKAPVNPVAGRTPGQRYQSYLTSYQKQHGPVRQQVSQRPLPTIESLLGQVGRFETPAQLEARANRMAQSGIAAQQALIREEAQLMRDEALRRMQAQAAAGRAAAAQNAGLFGMVGGEYNAAAQEIRGLGTNLANQMGGLAAADVANLNQGLAAVGAPGVAVGGPVTGPGLAGPAQVGVEAYRGGELAGQALGTAGQAAQFGLAGMVSAQNLRATQEAQAALMESVHDADTKRMAAVRALAAGRPEQAAAFLQQLQDAQRQQIGLASGLIQQRQGMRQAGFEQGMTKKEYRQKVKQQGIQNKMAWKELAMKQQAFDIELADIDATRSMALGYIVDRAGRPILKNGRRIPAKKLLTGKGSSSTTRSMTPGQRVELLQSAQQAAEGAFYGWATDDNGNRVPANYLPNFNADDPKAYGQQQLDYDAALRKLASMGLGRGDAQAILDTHFSRGESGRPVFTPAEIKFYKRRVGPRRFNWAYRQIQDLLNRDQGDAADNLINEIMSGGQNLAWVGPK